jgi:predicted RNA-binding Zn-ribbon protein involved in translation (DUF1610 family)
MSLDNHTTVQNQIPDKVYIDAGNKATFRCPTCGHAKVADVSRYKKANGAVKVTYKCACGNSRTVLLERRGAIRKAVNFTGTFLLKGRGICGLMRVIDISRTGLRIEMTLKHNIREGDQMMLEFELDNPQKSCIRREAVVKSIIDDYHFGITFLSDDHFDDLGPYLFYQTK